MTKLCRTLFKMKIKVKWVEIINVNILVHSNEIQCRKGERLGMDHVIYHQSQVALTRRETFTPIYGKFLQLSIVQHQIIVNGGFGQRGLFCIHYLISSMFQILHNLLLVQVMKLKGCNLSTSLIGISISIVYLRRRDLVNHNM